MPCVFQFQFGIGYMSLGYTFVATPNASAPAKFLPEWLLSFSFLIFLIMRFSFSHNILIHLLLFSFVASCSIAPVNLLSHFVFLSFSCVAT